MSVTIKDKTFYFFVDFGWFRADDFKLFSIEIFNVLYDVDEGIDLVEIVSIQIAKFIFAVGFSS